LSRRKRLSKRLKEDQRSKLFPKDTYMVTTQELSWMTKTS
jgi:hypothetical protein